MLALPLGQLPLDQEGRHALGYVMSEVVVATEPVDELSAKRRDPRGLVLAAGSLGRTSCPVSRGGGRACRPAPRAWCGERRRALPAPPRAGSRPRRCCGYRSSSSSCEIAESSGTSTATSSPSAVRH